MQAVRSQRLSFRNWTWRHTQCHIRHSLLINRRHFGFQDVLETIAQHPTVIAITGGGGALAALYRTPQFWNVIGNLFVDRSVLMLSPKPSHAFQPRVNECHQLHNKIKALSKINRGSLTQVLYITGRPGLGKTQLAREFGQQYFQKKKGYIFRNLFVGTLNASTRSSFIHSHINLAMELGCSAEIKSLESLTGFSGEIQTLDILSSAVKKQLRKRPGWMLILDNLSGQATTVTSQTLDPFLQYHSSMRTPLTSLTVSEPGLLSVAASYGVHHHIPDWSRFWPQPGDESWGRGFVIVTSRDRRLVETSSPYIGELFLNEGMTEQDAIALLEKVSDCRGDGCVEVVNSLDRVPLSIASAGFYIRAERMRNPGFSYNDYLTGLEKGIQTESEKLLTTQNRSYPATMRTAVAMAARQLACDPIMEMVFTILACCAQEPLPMSLLARILSVRADINTTVLESIRQCVLLQVIPQMINNETIGSMGVSDVERVSLYQGTRSIFRKVFLQLQEDKDGQSVTMETNTASSQRRSDLIHHVILCLIKEYEEARAQETVQSYRLQHLLIPHLETFADGHTPLPMLKQHPENEAKLLFSLGDAYLLKGKPKQAQYVLEKALQIYENLGQGKSVVAAQVDIKLGFTYRQLGRLTESEFILNEALSILESERGSGSLDVAMTLTVLSATLKSLGKYHDSEACLRQSLMIYESQLGDKNEKVATVLTNLGSTLHSLGKNSDSKDLYERALAIQEEVLEPSHPSIAETLGHLSTAYIDLGNPALSVSLLQRALDINKQVHGSNHITEAITLSQLSNAYYHLGDLAHSEQYAKEALAFVESTQGPLHFGVAIACSFLGSTYLDMGDIKQARELLTKSVNISTFIYGSHHMQTALAQTRLGNILRLEGNLQGSCKLLQTTLKVKEDILSTDHPSIAITLNALGKACHELGYFASGTTSLNRALSIQENVYPKDHHQILFTKADIARVLRDTGYLEQSAVTMDNAIKTYQQVQDGLGFTEAHPKYASMLAIYGLILRDLGELEKAKQFIEKCLRLQEQVLTHQNLMKAETICNLGTIWHRQGNKRKSMELLSSSLEMLKAVNSAHPVKATVLAAIGYLLIDLGEIHSGSLSIEEALQSRLHACGRGHPNIALYHTWLLEHKYARTHVHLNPLPVDHKQEAIDVYSMIIKRETKECQVYGLEDFPIIDTWKANLDILKKRSN